MDDGAATETLHIRKSALVRPELIDGDHKPQIILKTDRQNRILTISDNGIGMSGEEVINNIGTIAESGTRAQHQWDLATPSGCHFS